MKKGINSTAGVWGRKFTAWIFFFFFLKDSSFVALVLRHSLLCCVRSKIALQITDTNMDLIQIHFLVTSQIKISVETFAFSK